MRPSQLFEALVKQSGGTKLFHPTARNFDRNAWFEAFDGIGQPSQRDRDLLIAAIVVGEQVSSLRKATEALVHVSQSGIVSRLLAVAESNRQSMVLLQRNNRRLGRSASDGFVNLSTIAAQRFQSAAPNVENTVDGFFESITDALPIWLNRTFEIEAGLAHLAEDPTQRAARLLAYFSLELTYKQLWQYALWQDHGFVVNDSQLKFEPRDRLNEELWACWGARQSSLSFQYAVPDLYEAQLKRHHKIRPTRVSYKTVTDIEGGRKQSPKFHLGRPLDDSGSVLRRQMERKVLSSSYVQDFLDVPLTIGGGVAVTCNQLLEAWYVLRDAVDFIAGGNERFRYDGLEDLAEAAMVIRRDRLETAIASCCHMTAGVAAACVQFFSTEVANAKEMFKKGVWARPLLDLGSSERLCVLLPAIESDSPIRRIELWLERGGLEDGRTEALRGGNFEQRARRELAKALAKNPLGAIGVCSDREIKWKEEGDEEIDLLLRLGKDVVVVCELKSLLSPTEPQEKYNYLRKLKLATEQAVRKASWLSNNRQRIVEAFDIEQRELESITRFIPLVVLNQGYGLGFQGGQCPIVDLHFLRLYLSEPKYTTNTIMLMDKMLFGDQQLYSNPREAVEQFESAMSRPIVLARYERRIRWASFSVPTDRGVSIAVSTCAADETDPEDVSAIDLAKQLAQDSSAS